MHLVWREPVPEFQPPQDVLARHFPTSSVRDFVRSSAAFTQRCEVVDKPKGKQNRYMFGIG